MTFVLKMYEVSVRGFDPGMYPGRTAAQARAKAWRGYVHADARCTFKDFLGISSIRRVKAPDNFGEPIIVSGKPAFRVTGHYSGPYVAFVWPGSDQILHSHPLDVEPTRAAA